MGLFREGLRAVRVDRSLRGPLEGLAALSGIWRGSHCAKGLVALTLGEGWR